MEDLTFELNGQNFTLPPWAYTISSNNGGIPVCIVGVSMMDAPLVILGDPFLR